MESPESAALRSRVFEVLATRFPSATLVDRADLLGFTVDGVKLPLIDYSRGIRNPQLLDATLSVVSSADGPYGDEQVAPGVWRYDFRAGGSGGDNRKLIEAHRLGVDIILFRKLRPNIYQAVYPARVAHVDEGVGQVLVTLDDLVSIADHTPSVVERRWAEYIAKHRVHQPAFRGMVLRAYETQCTVCRFKHAELLDAAHITADANEAGDAVVTNGMAMCKIHHAAYDQNFLGITPDYTITINGDLLAEVDGPMLKHGLQEMHGAHITLPRRRAEHPDRERLSQRYLEFSLR
ncbi:HNH endonuclease [Demequina sp. NBRC 110053]|uniref:HNH endonuclease n=1 Tax=Demequina sp. NBRC 110053 TaxID=1570342 RepID=UPI00135650DF|nr:HNH endonuclease [Demequina sp. NBRC 110053]